MVGAQHLVGMAELYAVKGTAKYTCLGLGSCIGLALWDASVDVSGMIHIMLPEKFPNKPIDKIGKFADTGIPELIQQMEALGASKRRLVAAYAGGAQVFKFGSSTAGSKLEVGARNALATKEILGQLGIRVIGQDVGGTLGRTVTYDTATGEIRVRTVTGGEQSLCKLK